MATGTDGKTYWAALPTKDFAGELARRVDDYYKHVQSSGRLRLWRNVDSLWCAGGRALGEVRSAGEQGELTMLVVNHFRNIGQHTVNLVTADRPAFDAKAATADYDSEVQCQLAQSILDYDLRAKRLERIVREMVGLAWRAGEGWVLKTWDAQAGDPWGVDPATGEPQFPGSLRYESLHPLDVIRDPTRDISKPRAWLAARRWANRYELLAKAQAKLDALRSRADQAKAFNEAAEAAEAVVAEAAKEAGLTDSSDPTSADAADLMESPAPRAPEVPVEDIEALEAIVKAIEDAPRRSEVMTKHFTLREGGAAITQEFESDDVEVVEFYHDRTFPLPEGRRSLMVGETVIEDGPLPYKRLPLFGCIAGAEDDSCFGYSISFDLAPLQHAVDAVCSTVATNQAAFGVQSIMVPRGSGLDVAQVSKGLQLITYDHALGPPQALQLTKTAPETFTLLGLLVSFMETLSGISSVIRGDPQASLKSGSALAMVAAQAVQFTYDLQSAYVLAMEDITTGAVEDYKDFASLPQVALIAGKSNRERMVEWSGKDIGSVTRVLVDVGSAMSKTLAGRAEIAQQLVASGLVKDPRAYIEVVTTGRLEPVTEGANSEMLLIRAENEALAEGEPVPVIATDDHRLHILEHKSVLASPSSRTNAAVVQAALQHQGEHLMQLRTLDPLLLALLGIPVPPDNIGGPGGGPGGPAPGEALPPGPLPEGEGEEPPAPPAGPSGQPSRVGNMPSMPEMPRNPATGARAAPPAGGPTPTPPGVSR